MVIEQETIGQATVVKLSGTLVLGDGDGRLKDKIHSLVHQGLTRIALDLGDLSYMDSAGLGALVAAQATISRAGGRIAIFNLAKRVSDLLAITKLLMVFDVYDSKEAALAAL